MFKIIHMKVLKLQKKEKKLIADAPDGNLMLQKFLIHRNGLVVNNNVCNK